MPQNIDRATGAKLRCIQVFVMDETLDDITAIAKSHGCTLKGFLRLQLEKLAIKEKRK